jgi:transcriptional regulator with XRE-family HTH domain
MTQSVLTPAQCRAGRALVGWSQDDLATAARVAKRTIADFELGRRSTYDRTLRDLREAMEAQGAVFLGAGEQIAGGAGVRMKGGDDGQAL